MLFCCAADEVHPELQVEPLDAHLQGGREHEEGPEEGRGQNPEVLVEEGHIHGL